MTERRASGEGKVIAHPSLVGSRSLPYGRKNMTTTMKTAIERYRTNLHAEQEGAALYEFLAKKERNAHLAELYRRMAEVEQRHASVWADYLHRSGERVQTYTPGWRIRALVWLAERFGVSAVLPMISTMERKALDTYATQPEAQAAGMPQDEHSHARIFRSLQTTIHGGIAGPVLAQFEGRHRTTGGNALRAAVLGASDGPTSPDTRSCSLAWRACWQEHSQWPSASGSRCRAHVSSTPSRSPSNGRN
jgi:rubrerythrin